MMISLIIQLIIVLQCFYSYQGEVVDMAYVFNSETLYWPGNTNFTITKTTKGMQKDFW